MRSFNSLGSTIGINYWYTCWKKFCNYEAFRYAYRASIYAGSVKITYIPWCITLSIPILNTAHTELKDQAKKRSIITLTRATMKVSKPNQSNFAMKQLWHGWNDAEPKRYSVIKWQNSESKKSVEWLMEKWNAQISVQSSSMERLNFYSLKTSYTDWMSVLQPLNGSLTISLSRWETNPKKLSSFTLREWWSIWK